MPCLLVVDDAPGVREKFGVAPTSIPDYLTRVGDTADGFWLVTDTAKRFRTPSRNGG